MSATVTELRSYLYYYSLEHLLDAMGHDFENALVRASGPWRVRVRTLSMVVVEPPVELLVS